VAAMTWSADEHAKDYAVVVEVGDAVARWAEKWFGQPWGVMESRAAARAVISTVRTSLAKRLAAGHAVERYDPYGMPEYAGIRVDGAFVFNDAIPDEDLRLQIERATAVLEYRAAERAAATSE